jgi:hypothetical protein
MSEPGDKALDVYSEGAPLEFLHPCGGGVEYLHRSPASHRRRRKGNPVPGGITGLPCWEGYKYGVLALQVGGVSHLSQ